MTRRTGGKRILILDNLRGFSLLSMIAYHTMYDLVYMFGVSAPWFTGRWAYLWQQSICWTFILVSGAALHYGRHTARRGLIVLGCALALTLVTVLVTPQQAVWFGVLHFLGCAMLLAAAMMPFLRRVPRVLGLVLCLALFLFLKGVPRGYVGIGDTPLFWLPAWLYTQAWLAPLGLPGPGFHSADYFPLIPWFFLFLTGYFLWGLLQRFATAKTPTRNPLGWMGRHSLLIYMLHQPVIYGILLLMREFNIFI